MAEDTPALLTNPQVGELLGCSNSMASRLRAGKRLPGLNTMRVIQERLDVEWETLLAARDQGCEAFGVVLRDALARHQRQTAASDPAESPSAA